MRRTALTVVATLGMAGLATLGTLARSDDEPKPKADRPAAEKQGGFPDLVSGLKATPGCLGVETAGTSSGKRVIFAWFANRKAVMAWYNSPMHQGVMDAAGGPTRKPLADLPDPDEPILAIASITPSDKARVEGIDMPISQIAIELYRPLPGGASVGGTFAPAALKVPGHVRTELPDDPEAKAEPKP